MRTEMLDFGGMQKKIAKPTQECFFLLRRPKTKIYLNQSHENENCEPVVSLRDQESRMIQEDFIRNGRFQKRQATEGKGGNYGNLIGPDSKWQISGPVATLPLSMIWNLLSPPAAISNLRPVLRRHLFSP